MGKIVRRLRGERQKDFAKLMESLEGRNSRWTVWTDFVTMSATAISNAVDHEHRESREQMYSSCARKYTEKELSIFPKLFDATVCALEENQNQDFLGEMFMALELGNDSGGQFFTPYNISVLTASATITEETRQVITENNWITANDPACGAGALLIALANELRMRGINYQNDVLFTAQDIDFIAGCMCYIQISLLGCAGYVVIDNTLTNPSVSLDKRGLLPCAKDTIWFTPNFQSELWQGRVMAAYLDLQVKRFWRTTHQGKSFEQLTLF